MRPTGSFSRKCPGERAPHAIPVDLQVMVLLRMRPTTSLFSGVPQRSSTRAAVSSRSWRGPCSRKRRSRPSISHQVTDPLVHFGGQTTNTREICLDVQIQGVTRTCLLDTGSEVSLFPASLVPMRLRYGR